MARGVPTPANPDPDEGGRVGCAAPGGITFVWSGQTPGSRTASGRAAAAPTEDAQRPREAGAAPGEPQGKRARSGRTDRGRAAAEGGRGEHPGSRRAGGCAAPDNRASEASEGGGGWCSGEVVDFDNVPVSLMMTRGRLSILTKFGQ